MMQLLSFPSYVNGKDVHSDRYVYTINARSMLDDVLGSVTLKRRLERGSAEVTAAVVGRCSVADIDLVQQALAAAAAAAPEWAATPLDTRMRVAAGIRERLHDAHTDLVDILVAEGTPRALAEWQIAGMLASSSDETLEWCRSQMRQEFRYASRRLVIRRMPDGVVCVNPPQNAPAANALFGCLALAAGNTVVIRAPRSAPLGVMFALRELVIPVLDELGAPPGTLNVFCARPGPVLRLWLESPHVNDIFYTGSVEKGRALERDCVAVGKKPILELAGNDCVLVWRDADLDLAVEALTECFLGSGQICMVPNQVVVHPAVANTLLAKLCVAADALRPGYPDERDVLLSPVLRSERFFAYIREAVAHGAEVLCGARRIEVDGSESDTGPFLKPTVLKVPGLASCREIKVVAEETFFPLLPVIVPEPAPDHELLNQMIDFVGSNAYGLRNSLWAKDDRVIDQFIRRVSNGGLLKVNDSHVGFLPYLPTHGGTGLTGGAFGEANYPMLRTSHLQGLSVGNGVRPREAVFGAYTELCSTQPNP